MKRDILNITRRPESGFTIAEVLVSFLIFSVIVAITASMIAYGIAAQRNSLAMEALVSQGSYAQEYMSRHLRHGTDFSASNGEITFTNRFGEEHVFKIDNDRIVEEIGSGLPKEVTELVSSEVNATSMNFHVSTGTPSDTGHPRVTFVFTLETVGERPEEERSITFQNSVSQSSLTQ